MSRSAPGAVWPLQGVTHSGPPPPPPVGGMWGDVGGMWGDVCVWGGRHLTVPVTPVIWYVMKDTELERGGGMWWGGGRMWEGSPDGARDARHLVGPAHHLPPRSTGGHV